MPPPETRTDASRIAVLPAEVADGIAAGEVVDRPAAVAKELIENAIDAGAHQIHVRVQGAGQDLIEVVDDGEGMSPTDLRLAFQRHATSKLRSLSDLGSLSTLGFRGEALASIGAVARVEAISRQAGGGEGYRVVVEAGITVVSRTSSCPVGTRMSVSRLFFNTPARLKFLKQRATENAVIARLVADLALGNPAIAFQLEVDDRRVLETPGTGELRAAVAAIYDPETAAAMLAIDEPAVSGLISPPSLHRGTRDHLVILVNGRRIQHRNLAFAVEQAYRGLRDQDRYPLAVLGLRVDPSEVDVNVHPTKREVRFKNEGAIFALLQRACYHALRTSPLYQLETTDGGDTLRLQEAAVLSYPLPAPARSAEGEGWQEDEPDGAPVGEGQRLPPLTYVGQLLHGYLVAEAPDAVVLVDQHAAHERVLFDRLLRRLGQRNPVSQPLLMPLLIDLTPVQLAAFQQQEGWLSSLGFEGEPFGPHTVRLLTAPAEMPQGRATRVFEQLVADLAGERTPDRRLRDTAALIACHSAVRFGDGMSPEAARELLSSLGETDEPISCPHGRPTTLILSDEHLRRLFKRP